MIRALRSSLLIAPGSFLWLVVIAACSVMPSAAQNSAASNGTSKGAATEQLRVRALEQHGAVTGAQLVFLSPDAVRIDCPKRATIILCRAPNWKVCSYSLKTKKYFEVPLGQYVSLFKKIIDDEKIDLSSSHLELVKPEKFFSRRCLLYKPATAASAHGTAASKTATKFNGIWLGDDFNIPSQIGDLLDRELSLPPMHKVVMKIDYQRDDFNTHALTTTYCHERNVPSDWFELPPGLTKARTAAEVYPKDDPHFLP